MLPGSLGRFTSTVLVSVFAVVKIMAIFQRRAGMISHFMLGVAVPSQTPGERPALFYSFCKVGKVHSIHWRTVQVKTA